MSFLISPYYYLRWCISSKAEQEKKNGFTHYRKQKHKCKDSSRQFVLENQHTIGEGLREIARRVLCGRLSLGAICRLIGVSLRWMCAFAAETWATAPDDLGVRVELSRLRSSKVLKIMGLQLDEAWSFVGNKAWIWVAFEPNTKQVIRCMCVMILTSMAM